MLAVTIGIHCLPEIHYFFIALVGEHTDLVEQRHKRNATLAATNVGDDTKRAKLVAAAHNRHPGPYTLPTYRGDVGVGFLPVEADRDKRFVLVFLGKQRRKGTVGI